MKVPKLLRGAPAEAEARPRRRRRRRTRADAPRTIVPILDERAPAPSPLARDLDAARERLRRAIPPVDDEPLA